MSDQRNNPTGLNPWMRPLDSQQLVRKEPARRAAVPVGPYTPNEPDPNEAIYAARAAAARQQATRSRAASHAAPVSHAGPMPQNNSIFQSGSLPQTPVQQAVEQAAQQAHAARQGNQGMARYAQPQARPAAVLYQQSTGVQQPMQPVAEQTAPPVQPHRMPMGAYGYQTQQMTLQPLSYAYQPAMQEHAISRQVDAAALADPMLTEEAAQPVTSRRRSRMVMRQTEANQATAPVVAEPAAAQPSPEPVTAAPQTNTLWAQGIPSALAASQLTRQPVAPATETPAVRPAPAPAFQPMPDPRPAAAFPAPEGNRNLPEAPQQPKLDPSALPADFFDPPLENPLKDFDWYTADSNDPSAAKAAPAPEWPKTDSASHDWAGGFGTSGSENAAGNAGAVAAEAAGFWEDNAAGYAAENNGYATVGGVIADGEIADSEPGFAQGDEEPVNVEAPVWEAIHRFPEEGDPAEEPTAVHGTPIPAMPQMDLDGIDWYAEGAAPRNTYAGEAFAEDAYADEPYAGSTPIETPGLRNAPAGEAFPEEPYAVNVRSRHAKAIPADDAPTSIPVPGADRPLLELLSDGPNAEEAEEEEPEEDCMDTSSMPTPAPVSTLEPISAPIPPIHVPKVKRGRNLLILLMVVMLLVAAVAFLRLSGYGERLYDGAIRVGENIQRPTIATGPLTVTPDAAALPATLTVTLVTDNTISDMRLVDENDQRLPVTITSTQEDKETIWTCTLTMNTPYNGFLHAQVLCKDGRWRLSNQKALIEVN